MFDGSTVEIDGAFSIMSGCSISIRSNAVLRLGSGFLNTSARIDCYRSISIGHEVLIGPDVYITDGDSHRLTGGGDNVCPIVIHEKTWVGSRVTILKGVQIGKGSVVAAGSVVTKDVPAHSLVAGVPAKVIRSNIDWTP